MVYRTILLNVGFIGFIGCTLIENNLYLMNVNYMLDESKEKTLASASWRIKVIHYKTKWMCDFVRKTGSSFGNLLWSNEKFNFLKLPINPIKSKELKFNFSSRAIKRELIQDANYECPEQAQKEIFKYIEIYYNTKGMHSSLGYLSPSQFKELNS
jgi:hypothetical protein